MRSCHRTRQNTIMLLRPGNWKKRNTERGETRSKRCKGFRQRLKKTVSKHWLSKQGCLIRNLKMTVVNLYCPPVEQEARYQRRPKVAAPRSHHPGILLTAIPKLPTHRHNRNQQSHPVIPSLTPNTTGPMTTLVTGIRLSMYLGPRLMEQELVV